MMVPPDHPETARYREIAVMPFDGPQGEETADLIAKALSQVTVNGSKMFSVQDYRTLKDASEEYYQWMMNPPLNTETYSKIGRLLGVKAVYAGEMTKASADSTYDRSRSTECEQYDPADGKCIKEKKIVKRCAGTEGEAVLRLKLIDVLLPRIVYADDFAATSKTEDCSEEDVTGQSAKQRVAREIIFNITDILLSGDPSEAKKTELDTARQRLIGRILSAVSPHYLSVQIELMHPGKDVSSKKAREIISAALDQAGRNQAEGACLLFAEAGALEPDAPSLLFNLGACEEARERCDEARNLYQRAGAAIGKIDPRISEALSRLDQRKTYRERLYGMGY